MFICLTCLFCIVVSVLFIFLLSFKIYLKLICGWCTSNVCLVGKTAIVTGANSGIGYETAEDFAKRGARVILACRNEEKGLEAQRKIREATDNQEVVFKKLDLTSLRSVREFAKEINSTESRLDILVNNAGMINADSNKTEDGLLPLMAANHLGPFLLTNLLLDLMKKTGKARIVNVSSIMAYFAWNLHPATINEANGSSPICQYIRSKACNVLFTMELSRRFRESGITAYSLHPGMVTSELARKLSWRNRLLQQVFLQWFFKDCRAGAQTTIYCSVVKGIENQSGKHFQDCRVILRYSSLDKWELAKQLWDASEELVQLKSKKE